MLQNLGFRGSDWVGRDGFETLLYRALHQMNGDNKTERLGKPPLTTSSGGTEQWTKSIVEMLVLLPSSSYF